MLPLSQLRTIASACLALALLVLLPLPALANTIFVNGGCSFQEAFATANATAANATPEPGCEAGSRTGTDTIELTESIRVYTAGSGNVATKIIFDGKGHTITGRASSSGPQSLFAVGSDGDLTVKDVKIKNTTPPTGGADASVYIDADSGGKATVIGVKFENEVTKPNPLLTVKNAVVGVRDLGNGTVHVWHSRFEDSWSTATTAKPVVSGDGVTVYRSVFINNRGEADGFVVLGSTISASTITENTATNTGVPKYAVYGAALRNVTLAYNESAGITDPEGMKNSILYANDGPDCAEVPQASTGSTAWGPNSVQDSACANSLETYDLAVLTRSPDIDDDISHDSYYPLDPGADAIGFGWDCEVADQNGHPYGPNPCDLGAISSWDPDADKPAPAGPSPTPNLTRTPFHTPVPTATASPTPYPTVDGWMLFSDYDGVLAKTVTAAGVGIAHIVELGFISAIDIWGEVGWGVTACHTQYSNGTFVFLDAAGMPREAVTWPAAPPINGMACTYIETEGTVVMLRAERWSEPPTPTPRENLPSFGPPTPFQLQGCKLLTRDMVNLRAEEWGDVLTIIPYETELTAMEVTEEFYKVTFEEQAGYVHRDWVSIVAGVCAAPAEE